MAEKSFMSRSDKFAIVTAMQKTFIDKLAYIYLKDRKILATRSAGKDVWYTPGGKREDGEDDKTALIREVKEELNVNLITETIKYYKVFEAQAHGKPEGTIVRMTCYTADFKGELSPSNEIEDFSYFTFADKSKTSEVDHLIYDDLKENNFID